MWYIGSFGLVCLLFLLSWLLGFALLVSIGVRLPIWKPESAALGSVLGTSILILTSGWMSWLGLSMRVNGVILAVGLVMLALLILAWKRRRNPPLERDVPGRRRLLPLLSLLALIGFVTYLGLLSLLRDNAFDPYNDTIASISLGEYLQDHSFRVPVTVRVQNPAVAMTWLYQQKGLRMGVHFLLALVQSWIPSARSIDVFPAVSVFGIILTLLTVFLCCRWLVRMPLFHTLCACLLGFTNLNQAHYVADIGMMNQLYGISFMFTGLFLAGRLHEAITGVRAWIFLLGVVSATLVCSYSEMVPIFGLILLTSTVLRWIVARRMEWNKFSRLVLAGILTAIISNIELARAYHNISLQMHLVSSVIGWNITYSPLQFIKSWLGIFPSDHDYSYYHHYLTIGSLSWILKIVAAVVLVSAICGLTRAIVKFRFLRYVEYSSALIVFTGMLIYFSYFVKNPFHPEQMGQTWSISKLITYSFPLGICTFVLAFRKYPLLKPALMGITLVSAISYWPVHDALSNYQTQMMRNMTESSDDPFGAYENFTDIVRKKAAGKSVLMTITGIPSCAHFEIAAYYLYPDPVAANKWQTSGCSYMGYYEGNVFLNPRAPYAFTVASTQTPGVEGDVLPAGFLIQREPLDKIKSKK